MRTRGQFVALSAAFPPEAVDGYAYKYGGEKRTIAGHGNELKGAGVRGGDEERGRGHGHEIKGARGRGGDELCFPFSFHSGVFQLWARRRRVRK